jgi:hypothetical protein
VVGSCKEGPKACAKGRGDGPLVGEIGWDRVGRRASRLRKGPTEDVGDGERVDERRRGPL